MSYESKSTTPNTRQRQRTVKAAIKYLFDEVSLRGDPKKDAVNRIGNAAQPMSEAKRIAEKVKRDKLGVSSRGQVKKSEVDALYDTMTKKVGCLHPSDPHLRLWEKIDDLYAEGDLTRKLFINMSVALMGMLKGVKKEKFVPAYSYYEPSNDLSMGQRKDAEQKALLYTATKLARSESDQATDRVTKIPMFLDRRKPKTRDAA